MREPGLMDLGEGSLEIERLAERLQAWQPGRRSRCLRREGTLCDHAHRMDEFGESAAAAAFYPTREHREAPIVVEEILMDAEDLVASPAPQADEDVAVAMEAQPHRGAKRVQRDEESFQPCASILGWRR